MSDRFIVAEGSGSGHCCFKYSIFDTSKPRYDGDDNLMVIDGKQVYKDYCECWGREEAEEIAIALNLWHEEDK